MDIETRLIVGLGNPGREYERTRHNVGFEVVDLFARLNRVPPARRAGRATLAEGLVEERRVYLMKPTTYMNLSGSAVAAFLRQKPVDLADLIVVADDINLPIGKLRLRASGSDGGHNGLKSLISHLHSREFPRLRVGVGAPVSSAQQVDHVLGRFTRAEAKIVDEAIERAVAALEVWLREGIEAAMNKFNG
jgi:PTH1 family peptidyl-tRNA hydrolase